MAYIATRVRPEQARALAAMAARNEHSLSAELRAAVRAHTRALNDEEPAGNGLSTNHPPGQAGVNEP